MTLDELKTRLFSTKHGVEACDAIASRGTPRSPSLAGAEAAHQPTAALSRETESQWLAAQRLARRPSCPPAAHPGSRRHAGSCGSCSRGARRDSVGADVLEVAENRLDVATAQTEHQRDHALIGTGAQQAGDPLPERDESSGERRLGDMAAVRLPGVAEIGEPRVEPVFPAPLPQQLEKPFLEAPGDDPRAGCPMRRRPR